MEWEAIIADGMSDDGTTEVLESYSQRCSQLHFVANPERIVSTGLNAAIRAAKGEFILRMDAHTRYAPDYCRRCIDALTRTGADNVGGPARPVAQGTTARAIAAAYQSPFSTGGGRFHQEEYEGWVDTVPYGCWSRKTLEKLGMFDETLVRNQDDELNLRLLRSGGRIWQDPTIRSWYSPRASLSGLFQQYFQYGYWKIAVIRKHRLPASWRHLVPGMFVLSMVALLLWCAVAAATGAADTHVAALVLTTAVLAYTGATIIASLATARRDGWDVLPYLPLVFATYHASYGLGFLAGIVFGGRSRTALAGSADIFTRITR